MAPTRGLLQLSAKVVVAVLVGAYAAAVVVGAISTWTMADMGAYWDAAVRLRSGEQLYPAGANDWAPSTYHYAPWFAVLWIPLTFLPRQLVEVGWGAVLVACSAASVWPVIRLRSLAGALLAALLGSQLLATSSGGNVQPLVVALLVYGITRPAAPAYIGAVASLKLFPAVYLLVFAARGEWGKLMLGLGVLALLLAPLAFFDLSHYPRTVPPGATVFEAGPALWLSAILAAGTLAALAAHARSRWTWPSTSVAVVLASPRFIFYDTTYLLVGARARPTGALGEAATPSSTHLPEPDG